MSFHVAGAVVAFAAVQIWAVAAALNLGQSQLLPAIALSILIFGILPAARRFERQWSHLGRSALPSVALHHRFRRDVRRLWSAALLLPVMWVAAITLVNEAAATF